MYIALACLSAKGLGRTSYWYEIAFSVKYSFNQADFFEIFFLFDEKKDQKRGAREVHSL